jgi:hypothetical protein
MSGASLGVLDDLEVTLAAAARPPVPDVQRLREVVG